MENKIHLFKEKVYFQIDLLQLASDFIQYHNCILHGYQEEKQT